MPSGGVDIQLLGDKRLQRQLNSLDRKVQRKVVRRALREGAKIVAEAAKENAPVDEGTMRDSIKVRAHKARRRGEFGVSVRTGTREELGIPQDAMGYYPFSIEHGYINALTGQHVAANSFMRRAADENEAIVFTRIRRIIAAETLREAKTA